MHSLNLFLLLLLTFLWACQTTKVTTRQYEDEFPTRIFYQNRSCDSCKIYYKQWHTAWLYDSMSNSYSDTSKLIHMLSFSGLSALPTCKSTCLSRLTKLEIYRIFGPTADSSAFGMSYRLYPTGGVNRSLIFRFIDDLSPVSSDTAIGLPEIFIEE